MSLRAVLLSKAGRAAGEGHVDPRPRNLRNDQFRNVPPIMRARLGLGADGMPVAWDMAHCERRPSGGSCSPIFYAEKRPLDLPLLTLVANGYPDPERVTGSYRVVPHPVRIGAFRGNRRPDERLRPVT